MGKLILQCDFWQFFTIFISHRTKGSHGQIILLFFVLILEFKIQPGKPHAPKFKKLCPYKGWASAPCYFCCQFKLTTKVSFIAEEK